ncbi:MAG: acetyl-CoA carboxylase biotin carboxylase subunit [Calditrichaeota bacterium]|nr:MAG: acetyl-CoA carboxylase biotin carboxylase subunit [Calditrichota bacterium]
MWGDLFLKILIANRGEIALRIIRACKELDYESVAVYSDADQDSLHVKFADEAVRIGPNPSNLSYLKIPTIISAAEITNADAIHPGYGFLSENAEFGEICEACNIKFIGPSPATIRKMGNKSLAKETMVKAGVPVIPGSDGVLKDEEHALKIAKEIGFPVIIKASSGGGGRGMRIVRSQKDVNSAFAMARAEAVAAFGDPALYMEKFVENPRHIEVQLLGDIHGNIIHLGERECSIQRRHQKLIEESPSPVISEELRKKIGDAAVKGAKAVGYYSAGTMEFLLDKDNNFYFMEMNTRVQVEHPVTEMVTNVDVVKSQIMIAAGAKISDKVQGYKLRGHSIECRINAENPFKNFMPTPGKITSYHAPGGLGVRVDTHAYAGYNVPPYYDSMIAKLITWGKNREEAIVRMRRSLSEFTIEGISTTIPFHERMMRNEDFISGNFDTGFLERNDIMKD